MSTREVLLIHDLDGLAMRMAHVRASLAYAMYPDDPRHQPTRQALDEALQHIGKAEQAVAEAEAAAWGLVAAR